MANREVLEQLEPVAKLFLNHRDQDGYEPVGAKQVDQIIQILRNELAAQPMPDAASNYRQLLRLTAMNLLVLPLEPEFAIFDGFSRGHGPIDTARELLEQVLRMGAERGGVSVDPEHTYAFALRDILPKVRQECHHWSDGLAKCPAEGLPTFGERLIKYLEDKCDALFLVKESCVAAVFKMWFEVFCFIHYFREVCQMFLDRARDPYFRRDFADQFPVNATLQELMVTAELKVEEFLE
jgi:hypothetical protein